MGRDKVIYEVYENDKRVLIGDHNDVANLCRIKSRAIANYVRWNILIDGKYLIKNLNGDNKPYQKKSKEVSDEKIIDYLYRHLYEFGNTTLGNDPHKYLPKLEEMLNEKICVRECDDIDDPWNYEASYEQGVTRFRKGRVRKYYILEVM